MKKWKSVAFTMAVVTSMALSGCGSNDSTGEATKQASTEVNQNVQDSLVVGRGGDTAALDPAIISETESLKIVQQIFESLLTYKEGTTEIMPSLAESYEASQDGLQYTFKLRQGIKFHDGTDFNADAVVFNFTRWNDPKSPYKFEGDSFDYYDTLFGPANNRVIKEVKAVDPYTVLFTLNKPQPAFLQNIALPAFSIASPAAIKEKKEKFKELPIGTGPFLFKEWRRNDTITLEKNPNYWQKGLPKLNKIIVRTIPDNSARLVALQSGEIDLMEGVNPDDLSKVEGDSTLQKITRPPFNVGYLGFNTKKKPFDNPKVRQALSYAINKETIIQAFYGGLADPAKNLMPPTVQGYNDQIQDYSYDLEKAKSLLKEAGYPNGIDNELVFYAMPVSRPYMPDGKKIAEAIQADFAKIGVKTRIESPEWATYLDDTKKGEKDDLFLLGWTGDNGDPDNFLYNLLDKDNIGANNRSIYANNEVHEIFMKAQSEMAEDKRMEMYKKAQEIIHNDAPVVPLVHSTPLLAGKANLKGFVPSPTGAESYINVYFE